VGFTVSSSVVVNDLNVFRAGSGPSKADAPLLVDPDAVLPRSVAAELFEPIARRNHEVAQRVGCVEDE
jgi:hypothetical protein